MIHIPQKEDASGRKSVIFLSDAFSHAIMNCHQQLSKRLFYPNWNFLEDLIRRESVMAIDSDSCRMLR